MCCNRVELHCLALLLWMANCFDMVFIFICVQNKDQIEWFEVWPRSSKLEVKMVIFITACYHAFVFLMVRTIDLLLFLVIPRSPKTCSQNIASFKPFQTFKLNFTFTFINHFVFLSTRLDVLLKFPICVVMAV